MILELTIRIVTNYSNSKLEYLGIRIVVSLKKIGIRMALFEYYSNSQKALFEYNITRAPDHFGV